MAETKVCYNKDDVRRSLVDALNNQLKFGGNEVVYRLDAATAKMMVEILEDAVPVVRCKDCKHYQHDAFFVHDWCDGRCVTPEDYCSHGRENDV